MRSTKEMIIVGFGIFGFLFGAGNLLFPQQLGLQDGPFWFMSYVGFVMTDIVLSILAIYSFIKYDSFQDFMKPMGKTFTSLFILSSVILVMFLLVIPRTGTVIYEFVIAPNFPTFPSIVFYILYFLLAFLLALKPYRLFNIIGRVTAPLIVLLLGGALIFILANHTPIPTIESVSIHSMFPNAFVKGYETIDALATICVGGLLIRILTRKGYDKNTRTGILLIGGGITFILMAVFYAVLMYLGSSSGNAAESLAPIQLLDFIFQPLGDLRFLIIGLVLFLAGFNIVLGDMVVGSTLLAKVVHDYDDDKLDTSNTYLIILSASLVIAILMALTGFERISKIASPLLTLIYPPLLILFILNTINVRNAFIVRSAVYVAQIVSLLGIISKDFHMGWAIGLMHAIPFRESTFNWFIPCVLAGLIALFLTKMFKKTKPTTAK